MFGDVPFSLNPSNFFALSCDCKHLAKKEQTLTWSAYALPDTSRLCHEYAFAKVAMGWHEEGLAFQIQVDQPFVRSSYPDLSRGDSVELFIDTRDLKSAGFNTRFCHHFYFLTQPVEDHLCGEITHFRTEDNHPLCDPQALQCQTQLGSSQYKMKIFIPTQCLYGYDPKQFDRLGFTYRINRVGGPPQHFSVVSQDYQIDQQPSLWASIRLIA
ncbi:hypothetical protein [Candidatus Protochlamydia phocaeensis]|uniref:hypothetical protein n=1 Tax=Candidatus Protochlamydia phocaeensis TaxID=1414722 RepID=UPI0008390957|nr:hypothetical protein [Candidatus Protochlamydia phocaeensis]